MVLFKNREPSMRELRLTGLLLAAFGAIVGWLFSTRLHLPVLARATWGLTLVVTIFYYAVPGSRRLIYQSWMRVVYPLGWLVSHAILAGVFYLIMMPVGLCLRLVGYDPMQRRMKPNAKTFWRPYPPSRGHRSYFQQF